MKQAALCGAILFLLSLSATASADSKTNLYEGDRFAVTTEKLADGVYVLRRDPSWRLWVQSNTTIIVNDDDVILVDGGHGRHAENVVKEVRRITDKPVSVIVTTHWHGDHNIGHYVFKREWPDARIIAHEETRAIMAGGALDYVRDTVEADPDERLAPARAELKELDAKNGPEELRAYLRDYIAGRAEAVADLANWRLVLADETFTNRLVLHRGERVIELLHLGLANTEGDIVVWLPNEKIVAAGDIVVRPTPYGFGSYPRAWAEVLEAINALDYEILIPDHGGVERDHIYVDRLIALMKDISRSARAAIENGAASGDDIYARIDWPRHDAVFCGDSALLCHLFDNWFKKPIAEAAFEEETGGGGD